MPNPCRVRLHLSRSRCPRTRSGSYRELEHRLHNPLGDSSKSRSRTCAGVRARIQRALFLAAPRHATAGPRVPRLQRQMRRRGAQCLAPPSMRGPIRASYDDYATLPEKRASKFLLFLPPTKAQLGQRRARHLGKLRANPGHFGASLSGLDVDRIRLAGTKLANIGTDLANDSGQCWSAQIFCRNRSRSAEIW